MPTGLLTTSVIGRNGWDSPNNHTVSPCAAATRYLRAGPHPAALSSACPPLCLLHLFPFEMPSRDANDCIIEKLILKFLGKQIKSENNLQLCYCQKSEFKCKMLSMKLFQTNQARVTKPTPAHSSAHSEMVMVHPQGQLSSAHSDMVHPQEELAFYQR